MNKIYMTKRRRDGKTVVCSEKTRARGKVKSLVSATTAALVLSGTLGLPAQASTTNTEPAKYVSETYYLVPGATDPDAPPPPVNENTINAPKTGLYDSNNNKIYLTTTENVTAVGFNTSVNTNSTATGASAFASDNATSSGYTAKAYATDTIAIGVNSGASGNGVDKESIYEIVKIDSALSEINNRIPPSKTDLNDAKFKYDNKKYYLYFKPYNYLPNISFGTPSIQTPSNLWDDTPELKNLWNKYIVNYVVTNSYEYSNYEDPVSASLSILSAVDNADYTNALKKRDWDTLLPMLSSIKQKANQYTDYNSLINDAYNELLNNSEASNIIGSISSVINSTNIDDYSALTADLKALEQSNPELLKSALKVSIAKYYIDNSSINGEFGSHDDYMRRAQDVFERYQQSSTSNYNDLKSQLDNLAPLYEVYQNELAKYTTATEEFTEKQNADRAAQLTLLQEAAEKLGLTGTFNSATDVLGLLEGRSIAIGNQAYVSGTEAIGLGYGNSVSGARSNVVGTHNTVTGDNNNVVGNNNTVATAGNNILGNAVTFAAGVATVGNIALGNDSVIGAAVPTQSVDIRGTTYTFAGTNPTSVVTVGSAGNERQITNVAAGQVTATSTDAVNGSQLYAVVKAVEDLEAGSADTNTDKSVRVNGSELVSVTSTAGAADGITTMTDYTVSLNKGTFGTDPATGEVTAPTDGVATTADVADAINSGSFAVTAGGTKLADVGFGDTLSFVDGNGTKAVVKNGGVAYDINVKSTDGSIVTKPNTDGSVDLTVNTSMIPNTVVGAGKGIEVTPVTNGNTTTYTVAVDDTIADKQFVADEIAKIQIPVDTDTDTNTDKSVRVSSASDLLTVSTVAGQADGITQMSDVTLTLSDKVATKDFVTDHVADEIAKIKIPEVDLSGLITYEESVVAGDNITVSQDSKNATGGKEFKVSLNSTLTGIDKIGGGTGAGSSISFGDNTINAGGATISNIANPTNATDAATKAYVDDKATTVAKGDGISVTTKTTTAPSGAVNTEYTVSLDDATKAQLAKEESVVAKAGETNVVVTQPRTNGTGGNEYEVSLAKDLTGIDSIGKDGSKFTFNGDSISAGDVNITDVKSPVNATDAANKQYVDDKAATVAQGDGISVITKTTITPSGAVNTEYTVALDDATKAQLAKEESVSAGSNIVVKQDTKNATGGNNYNVSLAADLTGITSISNGDTTVKLGDSAVNVDGSTITNVASPVNATDATNKAYVDNSKTTVSKGDGITVTTTQTTKDGATSVDYAVALDDGTKATLAQVDVNKAAIAKGINTRTEDGQVVNHKLGDTISVVGDGKNISTTTKDGAISVKMADNLKVNSVMIEGTSVGIGAGGISAGGNKIYNVAAGTISPSSTDAVNGSQLYATNMNVMQNTQNIADLDKRMTGVENELDAIGAGSLAASGLPQATLPGKSMLAFSAGTYGRAQAVAAGFSRVSDSANTILKGTLNANTENKFGASIGLGFQW